VPSHWSPILCIQDAEEELQEEEEEAPKAGWWKWWLSLSVMDPLKRDSPRNVKVGKCDMR